MTEQEHIGSVAMGDSREVIVGACIAAADEAYNSGPDESAFRRAIMAAVDLAFSALSRPAQEPVAAYTVDFTGCDHMSLDVAHIERIAAIGSRGPTEVVYLYAAPQPTHGTSATAPAPSVNSLGLSWSVNPARCLLLNDRVIGSYGAGYAYLLGVLLGRPKVREEAKQLLWAAAVEWLSSPSPAPNDPPWGHAYRHRASIHWQLAVGPTFTVELDYPESYEVIPLLRSSLATPAPKESE